MTLAPLARISSMRRLLAIGAVLAASAPWLHAPATTATNARTVARDAVAAIAMPAGSQRLAAAPRAAPSPPDFDQPYRTFASARAWWSVPSSEVGALLARAPAGSTRWSSDPGGGEGVQIMLHEPSSPWFGPRWVVIAAAPQPGGARALVLVESTVVWTPRRLELPAGVRTITVRNQSGGAVLARVGDPARIAAVERAIAALRVDDAVDGVYACPEQSGAVGFSLALAGAGGAPLASVTTEACPPDARLRVGASASQALMLGDLRARLQAILDVRLPSTV